MQFKLTFKQGPRTVAEVTGLSRPDDVLTVKQVTADVIDLEHRIERLTGLRLHIETLETPAHGATVSVKACTHPDFEFQKRRAQDTANFYGVPQGLWLHVGLYGQPSGDIPARNTFRVRALSLPDPGDMWALMATVDPGP